MSIDFCHNCGESFDSDFDLDHKWECEMNNCFKCGKNKSGEEFEIMGHLTGKNNEATIYLYLCPECSIELYEKNSLSICENCEEYSENLRPVTTGKDIDGAQGGNLCGSCAGVYSE